MSGADVESADGAERRADIRRAFVLVYLTLGWMIVEAAVAIGAGLAAGSLTLTAFGFDSLIELGSALVLIWRLTVELRHGADFAERAERIAARIGGTLLLALAATIVAGAAWKLWFREGAEFSPAGLTLTVLAIPVMLFLSRGKLALATALGSRALRTDAVESITCAWMAAVVIVALTAEALTGAWWVDAVASLAIVWFVVREGREAWSDEDD